MVENNLVNTVDMMMMMICQRELKPHGITCAGGGQGDCKAE